MSYFGIICEHLLMMNPSQKQTNSPWTNCSLRSSLFWNYLFVRVFPVQVIGCVHLQGWISVINEKLVWQLHPTPHLNVS